MPELPVNERVALLTGVVLAGIGTAIAEGAFTYTNAEPAVDEDGNYTNVVVVTASDGATFSVTIEQL
jgi:hypothetical protein